MSVHSQTNARPVKKRTRLILSIPNSIILSDIGIQIVVLFCFLKYQVNSYGHGGTVSSPNRRLEQAVNQYFVHILSLVTDNNPA